MSEIVADKTQRLNDIMLGRGWLKRHTIPRLWQDMAEGFGLVGYKICVAVLHGWVHIFYFKAPSR